jgi:aflatoxin B1 aldehyde reductase
MPSLESYIFLVKSILGTMTFGQQVDDARATEILRRFRAEGGRELDSAYVYNEGATEDMLGRVLSGFGNAFDVATKANPKISGRLDAASVRIQLNESLSRMKLASVPLFYLHMPDPVTPLEETLEACSRLRAEGKFEELGLSNFPASLVEEACAISDRKGWARPTVYQGLYNGLSRKVEEGLFPTLRRCGLRFYAFNPLAGGLLSGKHKNFEAGPAEGRFALRKTYKDRYWKKSYFDALDVLAVRCSEAGIPMAAAALRWLVHHSLLESARGDGIIIGVSSLEQLDQNLSALAQSPLSAPVLAAFDAAWDAAREDSPDYYYFYTP